MKTIIFKMKGLLFLAAIIWFTNTDAQIITTVAGKWDSGTLYGGDGGFAINAQLNKPNGVVVDAAGNIYIADTYNNRIRKVTASNGKIATIAGKGSQGYTGDGGYAINAEFHKPFDVAIDGFGNIYVSDTYNHCIRKITAGTGIISTLAGDGNLGFGGNGNASTTAKLSNPEGIVLDASGNLFIADAGNGMIRKINANTGIITTVAGIINAGGYSGDGGVATDADMDYPSDVAIDAYNNIYIADSWNGRIRKVTSGTGIITTIAGNGTVGNAGDGGSAINASFSDKGLGVAVDAFGNLYISDVGNYGIRKVSASTGIITTVVGNGIKGDDGDFGPANSASIWSPTSPALDAAGNLYFADPGAFKVRRVSNIAITGIGSMQKEETKANIYPNPCTTNFTLATDITERLTFEIYDICGKQVMSRVINGSTDIDVSNLSNGIYNVVISDNDGGTNEKLVIAK